MKKYIVSFLIATIFLAGAPFAINQAKAADMTIRDFINLLIAVGVIAPDKVAAVNAYLATLDNTSTIPTCTAFTYSAWSACSASGTQTRSVSTQTPVGCTGGTPALSQSCTAQSSYTITFDANGGVGSMPDQTFIPGQGDVAGGIGVLLNCNGVNSNNICYPPYKITKTGYNFTGWATTPTGPVAYPDHSVYMSSSDIILYAVWDTSTVIFDANGGIGTMPQQTIAPNSYAVLAGNTFTKAGYRFAGWRMVDNSHAMTLDDRATIYMGLSKIYLSAVWELVQAQPTRISFERNSDTVGTMSVQTIAPGTSANINRNTFTNSRGRTFAGWSTSFSGPVMYRDQELITVPAEGGLNMGLYPIWNYNINFYPNGGTGTMATQVAAPGGPVRINNNTFTRAGYRFDGWEIRSNPTGRLSTRDYADGRVIPTMYGFDLDYYAQWKAESNIVECTFIGYGNLSACVNGIQTQTITQRVPAGCYYAGQDVLSHSCSVNDNPVTTYVVTFDANGGTGTMSPQVINANATNYLSISNAFSKSGYTFAGWSTTRGGAVTYNGLTTIAIFGSGDITLYAVWTPVGASAEIQSYGATLVGYDAVLRLINALR